MNSGINNIDIVIGSGNPQAVGIDFAGAQNSVIKNVKITNNGNFAGFYNLPGVLSIIGNIEVVGGKYGIYGPDAHSPSINNLRLTNQTEAAIYQTPGKAWPITVTGFEIIKQSAPVIVTKNNANPGSGNTSLHDGTIEVASNNSQSLIDNSSASSVVLQNVFVKGTANVVSSPSHQFSVPNQNWQHISEYAVRDTSNAFPSISYIGSNQITTPIIGIISPTTPDKNFLWQKHFWSHNPWTPDVLLSLSKTNNQVCIATNHSQINGSDDQPDTAGIQDLVNRCQVLFFPKGNYFINNTINLTRDIEILGASTTTTVFTTQPNNDNPNPWIPPTASPLFRTPDSASSTIRLFDFNLIYPNTATNPNIYGIHWRSGINSIINNVNFSHFLRPVGSATNIPKVWHLLATGHAAGKIYGSLGVGGGNNTDNQSYSVDTRMAKIDGITGPLQIYAINPENQSMGYANPDQTAQFEITNSQNVAIYGGKGENPNPYQVTNSNNILMTGLGGTVRTIFKNSSSIAYYNAGTLQREYASGPPMAGIKVIKNGQNLINTSLPDLSPITAYKDGQFSTTPFDALAYDSAFNSELDLNKDGFINIYDFSYLLFKFPSNLTFPNITNFISSL